MLKKKFFDKVKPKSEFSRNVLILMTGTIIAQAIPIIVSPILTRLYTAEDFGVFAVFVGITSILGIISNGRYEVAVILPKSEKNAINILALAFVINITFSLILFLFLSFANDLIMFFFEKSYSIYFLFLIPMTVSLIGIFNLLTYWNNRKKNYKNLSKSKIVRSISLVSIQIFLGIMKTSFWGLVISFIMAYIISIKILLDSLRILTIFKDIKITKIVILAKKYKDFPLYSSFSVLLNEVSLQIPIFMLSLFFSLEVAGFFLLANRILNYPISLIGNSLSQVLYQTSSTMNKKEISIHIWNLYKKLFLIGIIPFSVLFFWGDSIFKLIFGAKWLLSGTIAQYLSPWLLLVFTTSPLTILLYRFKKQREVLMFNISLVIGRALMLGIGSVIFESYKVAIILYAIYSTILWYIWGLYIFKIIDIPVYKKIKFDIIGILTILFLLALLPSIIREVC